MSIERRTSVVVTVVVSQILVFERIRLQEDNRIFLEISLRRQSRDDWLRLTPMLRMQHRRLSMADIDDHRQQSRWSATLLIHISHLNFVSIATYIYLDRHLRWRGSEIGNPGLAAR